MGCLNVRKKQQAHKQQQQQQVQPRNASDPAAGFKRIPVPLPPPMQAAALPLPRPTPPPLSSGAIPLPPPQLRSFDLDELRASIGSKPPIREAVYRASFGSMQMDVAKTRSSLCYSVEEWVAKLRSIAQLEYHPNVSRLLGFAIGSSQEQEEEERLVVFESSGSKMRLDRALMHSASSLDWNARLKVALATAKGLAHLHRKMPWAAYARSFGSCNVVLDIDCDCIKLVDYGLQPEMVQPHSAHRNSARIAPEPAVSSSTVRSYGILLLELLTGRQQSIVEGMLLLAAADQQWSRRFVNDRNKLCSILDPRLGSSSTLNVKATRVMANLALSCLTSEVTMDDAVALLEPLLAVELSTTSRPVKAFRRSVTFSYDHHHKQSSSTPDYNNKSWSPGFHSAGTSPAPNFRRSPRSAGTSPAASFTNRTRSRQ